MHSAELQTNDALKTWQLYVLVDRGGGGLITKTKKSIPHYLSLKFARDNGHFFNHKSCNNTVVLKYFDFINPTWLSDDVILPPPPSWICSFCINDK